ncbi:MAG: hypothetical protein ACFFHD_08335 [Promethearchaeota archaeon]
MFIKEKIEGYLNVKGKARITPNFGSGQRPYREGSKIASIDNLGEKEDE